MRRSVYLPVAGAALFILFVVSNLPLSLVLDLSNARAQGVGWSGVSGTVWSGTVYDVTLNDLPVGTVRQRTKLLPLLTGRITSDLDITGRAVNGQASVSLAPGRISLRDTAVLIDFGAYNVLDAFGAPLRGMLRVETDALAVRGEQCISGAAAIWTDSLTYSARAWGGEGFPLSGSATCSGEGVIALDLSGGDPPRAVSLDGTLQPSLDYFAEVTASGFDEEILNGLALYGFDRQGDQLVLIQRGNLLDPDS